MNPAYLLVTSTHVPVEGNTFEEINDQYFAKAKGVEKKEEEKFFAETAAQVIKNTIYGVGKENPRTKERNASKSRQAHRGKARKGNEAILGLKVHTKKRNEAT